MFTADKGGVLRPSNFRVKVWLPAIRAAGLAPLRPHDLQAVPGGSVVELPGGPARPVAAPARPTANQANKKTRRKTGPELG